MACHPKLQRAERGGAKDGGLEGIRTPDLCDANAALYQLSYKPEIINLATACPPKLQISLQVAGLPAEARRA